MKRSACILVWLILMVGWTDLLAQSPPAPKVTTEAIARIVRVLEDSGYKYSKQAEAVWSISFKGDRRPTVLTLITATNQTIAFDGVIALSTDVADASGLMKRLLQLNARVAGATLIIDSDGDYVARNWLSMKDLTSQKFEGSLRDAATAADDVYGEIAEFLVRSGSTTAAVRGLPVTTSEAPRFSTPPSAIGRIEMLNGRAGFAYDPTKWKETPASEPGVREFTHTGGDGYAKMIAERTEIPTSMLREIAIGNAKEAGAEIIGVEEQKRRVNGVDVLMLRYEVSMKGIRFVFMGYFRGSPEGTVQLITYTSKNLFEEYRQDFEDLLNGLWAK